MGAAALLLNRGEARPVSSVVCEFVRSFFA